MRIIPLIFCVFIAALVTHAQGTLEKIFYNLPQQYSLFEDDDKKKQEVVDMKKNAADGYYDGSFIDERNGYLRWIGYQCAYELCYWKNYITSSGDSAKLVAVIQGCMNKPVFLVEKDGQFTPISFNVFDTFDASHFFKEGTSVKTMKPYLNNFSFALPWKGRNIVAHYGGNYGERDGEELLKGDKIDFVWNNGVFEMGEPYF